MTTFMHGHEAPATARATPPEHGTIVLGSLTLLVTDRYGKTVATASTDDSGKMTDEFGADAGQLDATTGTGAFSQPFLARIKGA